MFWRREEEKVLRGLFEELKERLSDLFNLVLAQIKDLVNLVKLQEASSLSLKEKIEENLSAMKDARDKLEELKEKIETILPGKKVFLLVDGDYVLKKLFDLERRIYWPLLFQQITEHYGEITGSFLFGVFVNPKLALFLKRIGMTIIDTSTLPGEKGITDEVILNFLRNIIPVGATTFLFTGDRQLKRSAQLVANEKKIELVILDFDPQSPHPVRDSQGKIEVFLSLPIPPPQEFVFPPNLWKQALERFLQGKFVEPEKEEIDKVLLFSLHYLFFLLPPFPRPIGKIYYPRGFHQLAGDLLSFFHCLENHTVTRLSLSEGDAIAIIEALLECELLKKARIDGKELIYRAPHKEWGELKNWIPKPVGE